MLTFLLAALGRCVLLKLMWMPMTMPLLGGMLSMMSLRLSWKLVRALVDMVMLDRLRIRLLVGRLRCFLMAVAARMLIERGVSGVAPRLLGSTSVIASSRAVMAVMIRF